MKTESSQLRQNLTELLNKVGEGETIEITKYGKVVARLVPPAGLETVTPAPIGDFTIREGSRGPVVKGDPGPIANGQPTRARYDTPGVRDILSKAFAKKRP